MIGAMHVRHVARPSGTDREDPGPLAATGPTLRWGIVATGNIARKVGGELMRLEDARVRAVSSRDAVRARAFADAVGAASAYGDEDGEPGYLRLAEDPDVDVVYVATPHGQHHQVARALLLADKHVLVEKAFTVNAGEAEDLVTLARSRGLFLMEAVWTRFLPLYHDAVDAIAAGELGHVRWVQADLGFAAPPDPRSRMWAPEAGGGALLDLTVYAFTWAFAALGHPRTVSAAGVLNDLAIDELNALTLLYDGGALAQLTSTLVSAATRTVTIAGTDGILRSLPPLTNPAGFSIERSSGIRDVAAPRTAPPYTYMLREVSRCIQRGRTESPTMPLADTLATMRMFDEARRQMGVRYPNDDGWPSSGDPRKTPTSATPPSPAD
jgi:predicted dehydrogenase